MPSSLVRPPIDPLQRLPADLVLLALAVPWLLTFNLPPSSTFLNQAAAWAAWAVFVYLALGGSGPTVVVSPMRVCSGIWPMLVVFVLLGAACAVSPLWTGWPASLAWATLATLAGAALVLAGGAVMAQQRRVDAALRALFIPLVIAGSISSIIVVVQIFFGDLAGNAWIATSAFAQRASGNLRQPNHLSSLALWALIGVIWLHERLLLRRVFAATLAVGLVVSVVLTGSRTGLLGILILAAWAVADRGLSGFSRRLLWAMPFVYALGWWLFRLWASHSSGDIGAVDRIAAGGDISSARFAIWSNTLELIGRHPWFGVGFGEFNLAWSLTPFADRPLQFYDHTHNLLLQWAVELGLPLALLLTLACGVSIWRCFRVAALADAADRPGLRSAFMLVLLIMLHSMLEYPLWYSYFLLPTVFAFGICLGSHSAQPPEARASDGRTNTPLRGAAASMLMLSLFSIADYHKVAIIFEPPDDAPPLEARIADGKRSVFFAHHAHYAEATTAAEPALAAESFRNASHFLLDSRFMLAWAAAYAEQGDEQRARFLADRLREFRNPASVRFFEACEQRPSAAGVALPFQCRPADAVIDYSDFR